jgi:mannose/fructose/N-acetylgalactosamine-specific phosphotransferase system component IID
VSQGSILGPLLFLLYINDLTLILQKCATPVLFADDTSIIIKNNNRSDFLKHCGEIFTQLNIWLINNRIFLQFRTKNSHTIDINFKFNNKSIQYESKNFLEILLESTLK